MLALCISTSKCADKVFQKSLIQTRYELSCVTLAGDLGGVSVLQISAQLTVWIVASLFDGFHYGIENFLWIFNHGLPSLPPKSQDCKKVCRISQLYRQEVSQHQTP